MRGDNFPGSPPASVAPTAGRPVTTAAVVGGVDQTTQRILTLLREGKSDGRIAKRLGLSRDEVRARIDGVIRAAHLDEQGRVDELAEQVGLVAPPDEAADAS